MTNHPYHCPHCSYEPVDDTPACDCPSPEKALKNCPQALALKAHVLEIHKINWG